MDGKVLAANEIEEIAALPGKDALYAKVLAPCSRPSPAWLLYWSDSREERRLHRERATEEAAPAEEAPAAE